MAEHKRKENNAQIDERKFTLMRPGKREAVSMMSFRFLITHPPGNGNKGRIRWSRHLDLSDEMKLLCVCVSGAYGY